MCQILSYLQNFPCTLPPAWSVFPASWYFLRQASAFTTFASWYLTHSTIWILSSLVPQGFLNQVINKRNENKKRRGRTFQKFIYCTSRHCARQFTNINSFFSFQQLHVLQNSKGNQKEEDISFFFTFLPDAWQILLFPLPILPFFSQPTNTKVPQGSVTSRFPSPSIKPPWVISLSPKAITVYKGRTSNLFSQL